MPISSRFLSASLAALLAFSPCLPCYTLAYADEGAEVIADGQQDHRGTGSGDESGEGAEEPEPDSEAGRGSAAAEAEAPFVPEVPSGIDSSSGGSADSGMDGSSEDAYSSGWRDSESSISHLDDQQLGTSSVLDSDIMPLATVDSVYDQLVALRSALGGMLGMTEGYSSASNRYTWTVNGYQWSTGKTGIAYLISWLVTLVSSANSSLSTIKSNTADLSSILSVLRMQWGTSYGSTALLTKNSPAEWLQTVKNAVTYSGSVPNWSSTNLTLSSLVRYVIDQLDVSGTLQETGKNDSFDIANLSLYSANKLYHLSQLMTFEGQLPNSSITTRYGIAALLANVVNRFYAYGTLQETGVNRAYQISDLLLYIANKQHLNNELLIYRGQLPGWSADANSVATELRYMIDQLNYYGDTPYWSSDRISVSSLLYYLYMKSSDIAVLLSRANDFASAHSSLLSKGFADILAKMDNVRVTVSIPSVSVDMSGVESRLDDIKNLLMLAGVKDIVDTIVGDLDFAKLGALSGEVQGAVSNAFPFCVPAVLKQVLGLVRYDGAAPVWDFDIGGESMHVDLSSMQPLADVSGWVCRIAFTVLLLASSRRFVFVGGGVQ